MAEEREAKIARACDVAGCTPYAADLVFQGMDHALGMVGRRHLSAEEVVCGVACVAAEAFGLLAMLVLREHGLRDGARVGALVFAMVREGIMDRGEGDSPEHFLPISGQLEVFATRAIPVLMKKWGGAWAV